jgi:tetratricopeptide (TPR) repeat protein
MRLLRLFAAILGAPALCVSEGCLIRRRLVALLGVLLTCSAPGAVPDDPLVRDALAAEARFDTNRALELFQAAAQTRPDNAFVQQKIARQYSDAEVDATAPAEKLRLARLALVHSQRAVELEPGNPVNVLSVAISYGKLGLHSDVRTRIGHSRLVREYAERALALDPNYDWAHHVLGRWHHEVASLGATTRLIVKVVYGGLPDASHADAVRHLERAVALAPDTLAHHVELGFALQATGRDPAARAAWERALTLPAREKHDEAAKARARAALAKLKPATP